MLAGEILDAVEGHLRREHRHRPTVYRREWSIACGATRVDLAAINGQLIGCEIKSARDTFARLAAQVPLYSAVLDAAVLVVEGVAATHRAESVVPPWWGIWQAVESSAGAELHVVREPGANPSPDPLSIAQLVRRDEAYQILRRHGREQGLRTATRWRIWNALAAELPISVVQREVRAAIKARREW